MLRNFLTTVPYTKFILIEDNVADRGYDLFNFVVNSQIKRENSKIHFLVCENVFSRVKAQFSGNNVQFYDIVSNNLNWTKNTRYTLDEVAKNVSNTDIVIINSLSNAIINFGVSEVYRFLNILIAEKCVQQILTILHTDLLLDKNCVEFFEHLCTLSIRIKPKFYSDNARVKYRYKKVGGKIIMQMEEYKFENNNLLTYKIETDASKIEQVVANNVNPENLSTFRIGLSEQEKLSKENVVLPYLPKTDKEGKITYTMEDIDDWDEEDPDDDLDI
ncbi:unnamed protein product [Brassicogethes aeneus]|uniref:Elongator complex protein 5 n=1 Tax=Brassicogethes aeneus TaxID=1431903 RepID=A0A9P0AV75_BRAAE|nr:unnamed protein product [Brassicogethes aeneus]